MSSIIEDAFETYYTNSKLVALFSVPFIASLAIPLLAPLPTYIALGAVFLRSATAYQNLDLTAILSIVLSGVISLIFLAFSMVLISLIVKSKRTLESNKRSVLLQIESYTSRLFMVFLAYAILIYAASIFTYSFGQSSAFFVDLVSMVLFVPLFYLPGNVVIANKRTIRALKDSLKMAFAYPSYLLLWAVIAVVALSVVDFVSITFTGTLMSRYLVLVLSSFIVLPYLAIFQAEAYMKTNPIIRSI